MSPTTMPRRGDGAVPGLLHQDRIIAGPGFSRWMVPPAALCVHLCIGQAYAFSVFNLPMTRLIGITQSAPDDWKLTDLGWIFSLAIFFLGVSAALLGRWVEEGGSYRVGHAASGWSPSRGTWQSQPHSLSQLTRWR